MLLKIGGTSAAPISTNRVAVFGFCIYAAPLPTATSDLKVIAMPTDRPPVVNLTDPKGIVAEIFDNDDWVKEAFAKHFAAELLTFGEVLAAAFKRYPEVHALAQGEDEQALYVLAFVHGIFDDLITSTKLLVSGKMVPSGNLMRQALEGIAVAILCSYRKPLLIPEQRKKNQKKNGRDGIPVRYWERVKELDPRVNANRALGHVRLNIKTLDINPGDIDELKRGIEMYHASSHPSPLSLVARVRETETTIMQFIGGVFNEAMIPVYRREIEQRANLCRVLPNLIDLLLAHLRVPQ